MPVSPNASGLLFGDDDRAVRLTRSASAAASFIVEPVERSQTFIRVPGGS